MKANLRICGGCEWIFDIKDSIDERCPKCGFAHYGARRLYGDKAYKYKYTQEPWKRRELDNYEYQLDCEIIRDNTFKKKKSTIDLKTSLIKTIEGE